MRLVKISGIESTGRDIEELAEAVEAEVNMRALDLRKETPNAQIVATSVAELKQGLLVTLTYEIPDR